MTYPTPIMQKIPTNKDINWASQQDVYLKVFEAKLTSSFQQIIFDLLREFNIKISVAESLTGGLVAASLVGVAGISQYFIEGIVSYSNEAKKHRLGVADATLKNFGAVSAECATEMAEGLLFGDVSLAVSTTGIAGPDGGSDKKPVGTVYFGLAERKDGAITSEAYKMVFEGGREQIRQSATNFALLLIIQHLSKNF